ncbi:SnoaL-like domain-containing protein [Iamia sp. SCSIO 61187]|uniref:nuclear transport factor 2 family protein n=1 Tax=Iamia sp. SCSIO 61187 TaxID=2722752 RepID=UPI001C637500|nr:nuclear transport factor 2 family protein [Iamia sp. SCSIO 61187]QYG94684.1 SnoaL-like domain-containing protein [Iamia sp. SCSIO 61187]
MASEQSPVAVVEAIYAAMAARDFGAVLARLGPDFVVTQDPRLPWGGRYEGPDGFATLGLALLESIESQVTTDAIFEADGDVLQVGRTRGTVRATGTAFDIPEVHRWTIVDGLAVRAHFAIDTPAMLAALGRTAT